MIVVMKAGASRKHIQHVVRLVREWGLKDRVIEGSDRTVVACLGDQRTVDKCALENAPMVDRIVPILAPYKLASMEVKSSRTQVRIGPNRFPIGGRRIGVIAGPCAVENRDQLLRTAEAVAKAGAIALRGGAFKPRTSPYVFQGLGVKGLQILADARERTGLAIVTEVVAVEQVEDCAHYSDVLQIGSRNMQHYPLLEACGRIDKPILLKRGFSATMQEWLLAAEYIIHAGNSQVILCERGLRTFEDHVRNTLPLASVPYLNAKTHLPVVVDPSHGTGHASLVPAMCRAAVAAGADALLIECHVDPEHALSDGAQSITPAALKEMMPSLKRIAAAVGRTM